jgi:hypothetical protein
MKMLEKVKKILEEAADADINLHSEVARAMLAEKIILAYGFQILEENNG